MSEEGNQSDDDAEELWGLPIHISNELAPTWDLRTLRWTGDWSALLIMIGGLAIGWLWIWPGLETMDNETAAFQAAQMGGLMYETVFGFGLLAWLFAWLILSTCLTGFVVLLLPMPAKGAVFFGIIEDSNSRPMNKRALDHVLNTSETMTNASTFLNAWASRFISSTLKYAVPLALIGTLFLLQEFRSYSVYSEKGYYLSSLLPWIPKSTTEWSDAERVQLGCNHTDDGGSVVYKVYFDNGKSIRIDDGIPVGGRSWLDSMEAIDLQLVKAAVSFERWRWKNRNPLHPKCLRGYYGQLGKDDGDRLRRLLRVGEFASDTSLKRVP